jgi:hypothetical protein
MSWARPTKPAASCVLASTSWRNVAVASRSRRAPSPSAPIAFRALADGGQPLVQRRDLRAEARDQPLAGFLLRAMPR